jgi:hypothetical protein
MSVRSEKLIEWSHEVTSKADAYDPLARQLKAIAFVASLRSQWLDHRKGAVNVERLIESRITGIIREINPQLDSDLEILLKQSKQETKDFYPRVDVAEFYKNRIFGFDVGIVRKLQSLSKYRPNQSSSNQEMRVYYEMLTSKWNEVLNFPEELIIKTNNGLVINLQDGQRGQEEDIRDILQFIDACTPSSIEGISHRYRQIIGLNA